MKDEFSDQTVILLIVASIIIVFLLIFSVRPTQNQLQPDLQWKDSTPQGSDAFQI